MATFRRDFFEDNAFIFQFSDILFIFTEKAVLEDANEDHQGNSRNDGRDEEQDGHQRCVPQGPRFAESQDKSCVAMDGYGEGYPDQPEKPCLLFFLLEHEITIDDAIDRIEDQEERPPGYRGFEIQVHKQMPSPVRYSYMKKEE